MGWPDLCALSFFSDEDSVADLSRHLGFRAVPAYVRLEKRQPICHLPACDGIARGARPPGVLIDFFSMGFGNFRCWILRYHRLLRFLCIGRKDRGACRCLRPANTTAPHAVPQADS